MKVYELVSRVYNEKCDLHQGVGNEVETEPTLKAS
jgi:hypothetical protein